MCRPKYKKAAAFSEKSDQQTADNPLSRSRWFGKEEKCLTVREKNFARDFISSLAFPLHKSKKTL